MTCLHFQSKLIIIDFETIKTLKVQYVNAHLGVIKAIVHVLEPYCSVHLSPAQDLLTSLGAVIPDLDTFLLEKG